VRETHTCAVEDCKEQIPAIWLMCSAHWARVPLELRRPLHAAEKRRHAAYVDASYHASAVADWLKAARAAIAAASGVPA